MASSSAGACLELFRPLEQTNPYRPQKRIQIEVACNACRDRKQKCSGHRPVCNFCATRGFTCVYRADSESRARDVKRQHRNPQARVNKHAEENTAYSEIFSLLQTAEYSRAQAALRTIRMGAGINAVLEHIRGADLLYQLSVAPNIHHRFEFPLVSHLPAHIIEHPNNPYLRSQIYEGTIRALPGNQIPQPATNSPPRLPQHPMYLMPFQAISMVDPRLGQIDARRWTNVTHNNDLVRNLLEIYFVYEYVNLPYFHKDLFLDDMASGRSRYCSSLLVNAVLAAACRGNLTEPQRSEFWNPSTLGYRFTVETKRLWELEVGEKPKLTTVQAAGLISVGTNLNGVDKVGWLYLLQAVALANQLGLYAPEPPTSSPERRIARAVTAWTLFSFQSFYCFHFFLPPLISDPPPEPLPSYANAASYFGEILVTYPHSQIPVPLYAGHTIKALCEFRVIMNNIGQRSFSGASPGSPTFEETLTCREELDRWLDNLPLPLQARNIIFPSQLKLHIYYHHLITFLFTPSEKQDDVEADLTTSISVAHREVVYLAENSNVMIETIVRLYYLRHGFNSLDSMMLPYLASLGYYTLTQVRKLDPALNSHKMRLSSVLLCLKGIYEQGRNQYIGDAVYWVMRKAMESEHASVLQNDDLSEEERLERLDMLMRLVSSKWPVHIISMGDVKANNSGLSELIRVHIGVSVDSDQDGDGPRTPPDKM